MKEYPEHTVCIHVVYSYIHIENITGGERGEGVALGSNG